MYSNQVLMTTIRVMMIESLQGPQLYVPPPVVPVYKRPEPPQSTLEWFTSTGFAHGYKPVTEPKPEAPINEAPDQHARGGRPCHSKKYMPPDHRRRGAFPY